MSDKNTEDSIEERVVNKLKKVILIKKELSDKQKQHIKNLSDKKRGKKFVEKVDISEIELPTDVVTKGRKVKKVVQPESESESEEVLVKKTKKPKKIRYIEESDTSTEEVINKKPIKKVVQKVTTKPKAKPKPKPKTVPEPIQQPIQPLFNKKLF
jgi:hypothetical protein